MKTLSILTLLTCTITFLGFGHATMSAQPGNDHIADAVHLGENPIPYTANFINFPSATFAGDATPNPCAVGVAGIWFTFRAGVAGTIEATLFQPSNPIVLFFEGPENAQSGQELTWVDQPDNPCDGNPSAKINTTAGVVYYIFMANDGISEAMIDTQEIFQAPMNDFIENATDINGQAAFVDEHIHTFLSTNTNDGGQLNCDSENNPGIWYSFTAAVDGEVTAETSFDPGNGAILFYESLTPNATSGSDLTWVNQTTNPCAPGNESSIDAIAGKNYYIFISTNEAYTNVSVNLSDILGTSDNTIEGFVADPNPVSNHLKLKTSNSMDSITIYNTFGQIVYSKTIGATQTQIELSHLQSGLYILEVVSEGKTGSYKIVKE